MTPLQRLAANLDFLDANKKPLWGIMTPQHMVEHLISSIKISNGKNVVRNASIDEKRIPVLKKFLMSNRPLPKNFTNPLQGEGLIELEYSSLEKAIEALKNEILDYENYFMQNPDSVFINPSFGELNKQEWDMFHKKHFTHHLSQFGLLNEDS